MKRPRKNFEKDGVSAGIARNDPLEGTGEVNYYGERVSTWGDFASKLQELHPELSREQVFEILDINSGPYTGEDVHSEDRMPQRTIHNPRVFSLAQFESRILNGFEREARPAFEEQKKKLLRKLSWMLEDIEGSHFENPDYEEESAELISLRIEQLKNDETLLRAHQLKKGHPTITYEDIFFAPDDDKDRIEYYAFKKEAETAQDTVDWFKREIALLERRLQSLKDFGTAISLREFELKFLQHCSKDDGDNDWDMRETWLRSLEVLLNKIRRDNLDEIPEGLIYITFGDIDAMGVEIQDSNYELRRYAKACWETYIEPIAYPSREAEEFLLTGEREA